MIAVVGRVAGIPGEDGGVAGLAGSVALAAAGRGSRVELVAKLGDDPAGDRLLFALTRAGVGHAAILRDPARSTPLGEATASDGGADERADEPSTDQLAEAPPDPNAARTSDLGLELAPGDLELALRYLTDATVIVLADPVPGLVPVAVDGAGFTGAALVILGAPGELPDEDAAPGATVFASPGRDPGGAFAALVAEYAVELDAGRDPGSAWAAAARRLGAEPA